MLTTKVPIGIKLTYKKKIDLISQTSIWTSTKSMKKVKKLISQWLARSPKLLKKVKEIKRLRCKRPQYKNRQPSKNKALYNNQMRKQIIRFKRYL